MQTLDCVLSFTVCTTVSNSPSPPRVKMRLFFRLKFKYSKPMSGSMNEPDSIHFKSGCEFLEFHSANCDALKF